MSEVTSKPSREINGDGKLNPIERIHYLFLNAYRAFAGSNVPLTFDHWSPPKHSLRARRNWGGSPVRIHMEEFLLNGLGSYCPPGRITVLDVGCGSGRTRAFLEKAGYCGNYTGVDINGERFAPSQADEAFTVELIEGDATALSFDQRFNLAVSISALEHIEHDSALVQNIERHLTGGGSQVHLVPASASLWLYLWHGYRQYSSRTVTRTFDSGRLECRRLGGLPSFLLHMLFITIPENLFRIPLRRWLGPIYGLLNCLCVSLDRYIPVLAATVVIIQPGRLNLADDETRSRSSNPPKARE